MRIVFRNENIPFKVLDPAPENHKYYYYQNGNTHPDFNKRMEYYRGFEKEIKFNPPNYGEASQFLIIFRIRMDAIFNPEYCTWGIYSCEWFRGLFVGSASIGY